MRRPTNFKHTQTQ